MLDAMMVDSEPEPEPEHGWALSEDFNNAVTDAPNEAREIDEAETELTPRPRKKGNQDPFRYVLDLSADDNDEPFQTPLTLRKKLAKERVQVVTDSDDQEAEETPVKRKRNQVEGISNLKKKETKGNGKKEAVEQKRDQVGISKKKETKGDKKTQVGLKA